MRGISIRNMLFGALTLALCVCGGPLSAQVSASERALGEALFEEAQAALEANDLPRAESLLRRSLAARPWSFVAFKLAETLTSLGRPVDALEVYEEIAEETYGVVEGEALAQVRAALTRATDQIAHIDISWRDSGQDVRLRIDGESRGSFEENSASLRVNPGNRLVRAEMDGAEAFERRLRVEAGSTATLVIEWRGAAEQGHLIVRAEGAQLILGDVEGRDSLDLRLDPGEYLVELRNEIGADEETVEVVGGETRRYEFRAPRARNRTWLWVLGGVLVVGAAAAVTAIVLTRDASTAPVDLIGT